MDGPNFIWVKQQGLKVLGPFYPWPYKIVFRGLTRHDLFKAEQADFLDREMRVSKCSPGDVGTKTYLLADFLDAGIIGMRQSFRIMIKMDWTVLPG